MSGTIEHEIKFFGHYYDPEKNNDKIWGWVIVEGKMYNFWGRRDKDGSGKSLQFKIHHGLDGRYNLSGLVRKKERSGYRSISLERDQDGRYPAVESVYPNFIHNMKSNLMFKRLSGQVIGEG